MTIRETSSGNQLSGDDLNSTRIMMLDDEIKPEIVGWIVLIADELGMEQKYSDFPLFKGKNLVGTSKLCDITLPYQKYISKVHASIRFIDSHFIYTDCDSDEGSYINDQTVVQAELNENDIITMGILKFKFKCFQSDTKGKSIFPDAN